MLSETEKILIKLNAHKFIDVLSLSCVSFLRTGAGRRLRAPEPGAEDNSVRHLSFYLVAKGFCLSLHQLRADC